MPLPCSKILEILWIYAITVVTYFNGPFRNVEKDLKISSTSQVQEEDRY
jgi:hypothetical protein